MTNIWDEREKALENQFIRNQEQEKIAKMRTEAKEQMVREMCHNRCPKCGDAIEPLTFRGVPLDKCPGCGGVWLGPNDLKILATKDHRSWFDLWFRAEEE
jgi:rubrerythrin